MELERPHLSVHFSSQTDDWATPQSLFDLLNNEFQFTLDPAASIHNAKVTRFYTKEQDGLVQDWRGERVFCNPPYGRVIGYWVEKMATGGADLCVGVLPARTDTRWFHQYILTVAEIRYIKGRITFGSAKHPAPFPSMICIWRNT